MSKEYAKPPDPLSIIKFKGTVTTKETQAESWVNISYLLLLHPTFRLITSVAETFALWRTLSTHVYNIGVLNSNGLLLI